VLSLSLPVRWALEAVVEEITARVAAGDVTAIECDITDRGQVEVLVTVGNGADLRDIVMQPIDTIEFKSKSTGLWRNAGKSRSNSTISRIDSRP
jgi:hypothetical protein